MIHCIQIAQKLIWEKAFLSLRKRIDEYIKEKKRIALFLSGGSVVKLYGQLGKWIEGVAGNAITFAQVDERFQPNNREQVTYNIGQRRENINAEVMGATGLWTACEKKEIPYYCVSQEGSLKKSSQEYNQIVERLFHEYDYKIAILGIGQDGHTAGLLPGYQKKWDVNRFVVGYELENEFHEKQRKNRQNNAAALFCQQYKKRITLTPKAIKMLDYALVVAVGEKKREVIKKIQNSDHSINSGQEFRHEKDYGMGEIGINNIPALLLLQLKQAEVFTD